jgi:hypothetical protein
VSGPGEAPAADETHVAPLVAGFPGDGTCAIGAVPSELDAWPDELLQEVLSEWLVTAEGSGRPAALTEFMGAGSVDPYMDASMEGPRLWDPCAGVGTQRYPGRSFPTRSGPILNAPAR